MMYSIMDTVILVAPFIVEFCKLDPQLLVAMVLVKFEGGYRVV